MRELQAALRAMGLSWNDVWALSLDRRAGTLVVVTADGRKVSGRMAADGRRPTTDHRPPTTDPLTH